MLNTTITVEGTATQNPTQHATKTGKTLTKFNIAVNETTKNPQTGQWEQTNTTYYTITTWGTLAENTANHIKKGTRTLIHGEIKQTTYTKKDGTQGTNLEINAKHVAISLQFPPKNNPQQATGANHDPWAQNTPPF